MFIYYRLFSYLPFYLLTIIYLVTVILDKQEINAYMLVAVMFQQKSRKLDLPMNIIYLYFLLNEIKVWHFIIEGNGLQNVFMIFKVHRQFSKTSQKVYRFDKICQVKVNYLLVSMPFKHYKHILHLSIKKLFRCDTLPAEADPTSCFLSTSLAFSSC